MNRELHEKLEDYLVRTKDYLDTKLIPFWSEKAVDQKYGGFQTNYDRDGNRN